MRIIAIASEPGEVSYNRMDHDATSPVQNNVYIFSSATAIDVRLMIQFISPFIQQQPDHAQHASEQRLLLSGQPAINIMSSEMAANLLYCAHLHAEHRTPKAAQPEACVRAMLHNYFEVYDAASGARGKRYNLVNLTTGATRKTYAASTRVCNNIIIAVGVALPCACFFFVRVEKCKWFGGYITQEAANQRHSCTLVLHIPAR